jgi:DNA-binding response OmpR family regulator
MEGEPMRSHVLLIDDDLEMHKLLAAYLTPRGFDVVSADDGLAGLRAAYQYHPSIILLDVCMPQLNGWEVCERLRAMTSVPIVMLTALNSEAEVVRSFAAGADDFIRKPFGLKELEARLRALLQRRASKPKPQGWSKRAQVYDDQVLRIDPDRQQVWRFGRPVSLTPTELRLLSTLLSYDGAPVPYKVLAVEVWGQSDPKDLGSTVAFYISSLRKKLEAVPNSPEYILTHRGIGYAFALKKQRASAMQPGLAAREQSVNVA